MILRWWPVLWKEKQKSENSASENRALANVHFAELIRSSAGKDLSMCKVKIKWGKLLVEAEGIPQWLVAVTLTAAIIVAGIKGWL